MSQGRPCVSRANFIGSRMVRSIIAAAVQQSTRSLHSDRATVLWLSRAKYVSVPYEHISCLAAAFQQPCVSCGSRSHKNRKETEQVENLVLSLRQPCDPWHPAVLRNTP